MENSEALFERGHKVYPKRTEEYITQIWNGYKAHATQHTVSSTLKQLLKQFPIFPQQMIDVVKQDLRHKTFNLKLFQSLCCTLPEANRKVLETLLSFMNNVCDEKSNLMSRNQVAMAMLPSIFPDEQPLDFEMTRFLTPEQLIERAEKFKTDGKEAYIEFLMESGTLVMKFNTSTRTETSSSRSRSLQL